MQDVCCINPTRPSKRIRITRRPFVLDNTCPIRCYPVETMIVLHNYGRNVDLWAAREPRSLSGSRMKAAGSRSITLSIRAKGWL